MATVKTIIQSNHNLVINVTGAWDTADETDVVLVDRSALIGPDGINPPNKIRIDEVTYSVGPGYSYALLEWDDTPDETIEYFQGAGYFDYRPFGGKSPESDPVAATDGDVVLTTLGGEAGDTYSMLIKMRLK